MPRVTLVRYTTKPECTRENEALALAVFKELEIRPPAGIAYALFREGDDWVHLFVNLREDDSAAITELPTFKTYQSAIGSRCVAPPEITRTGALLLESFGFK